MKKKNKQHQYRNTLGLKARLALSSLTNFRRTKTKELINNGTAFCRTYDYKPETRRCKKNRSTTTET